MNKKLKKVVEAIAARLKKDTLSEDAAALWEEVRAAFEALAEDGAEHDITELQDKFDELAAKYDKQNEEQSQEVAERIQKLRNEIFSRLESGKTVKDKLTPEIAKEVANAIAKSRNRDEVRNGVEAVLKQNGITGLTYGYIVDYSLELKLEDNEGLYDELHKTPFTRFIYSEIDRTEATQIAKQWDKSSETEKAIQELAANDRKIDTKYIYKRQQFALEDLDEIEALIVCFSDFIGYVHVDLFGDRAVSMSELSADCLDRDTGLRHEGRVRVTERVNGQRGAVDLRDMFAKILGICFVVHRASVAPREEQGRPDTVS